MNKPDQGNFADLVRSILLHDWDPIGIASFDGAVDEYDSYVPAICELVTNVGSVVAVEQFLYNLATLEMEVDYPEIRTKSKFAAKKIIQAALRLELTAKREAE